VEKKENDKKEESNMNAGVVWSIYLKEILAMLK
jgi:hypothetical protein